MTTVDLSSTMLEQAIDLLLEHNEGDPDCVWHGSEPCDPDNPAQADGWCVNCRTKWFLAEWERQDIARAADNEPKVTE